MSAIKEATPFLSVLLMLGAAVCGALGSFLYKTAAQAAGSSMSRLTGEIRLWGGIACYLLVMVFFIAAFRNGGALSVLYPVYASTFIISAAIGLLVFGTPITGLNATGMILLVGGMYLMGVSK